MLKLFGCSENRSLRKQIEDLTEEVAELKRVNESYHSWSEIRKAEFNEMRIRCGMYDQIMKGLNININLNEKKK